MSFNTFTGSNWRASGGINRRKFGNFFNSDQVTTGTLNVQNSLGSDLTNIPLSGNLASVNSSLLYQLEDDDSTNINSSTIIYYPLNSFNTDSNGQIKPGSTGQVQPPPIQNETTNQYVYTENTKLNFIDQSGSVTPYSFNSNYPGLTTPQNAIQFRNNSTTLELEEIYNTQNLFTNLNYQITAALNFTCRFYIYYDGVNHPEPFNIIAFDTIDQQALVNNSISNISNSQQQGPQYTISNEALYISIPNANENNTGSIYFTTIQGGVDSSMSTSPMTRNSSIYQEFPISDYYNKWCTLEFSLGGTSIVCYINNNPVLDIPYVANATFVPETKFYINNGPYFPYDNSSTGLVIGKQITNKYNISSSTNNSPIASLLSYKIGNFTIGNQSDSTAFANAVNQLESEEYTPTLPNANNKYLNYLIGGGTNYLAQTLTLNNGLTNNGFTNNIGLSNHFGSSQFYGVATFYGGINIDSSVNLVIDASSVAHLNIYTYPGSTTNEGSLTISNAVSTNPSMLVYNSTGQEIKPTPSGWQEQGLIFSISGENVSVGEGFGDSSFNVFGDSVMDGNLTITGTGVLTANSGIDTTVINSNIINVFDKLDVSGVDISHNLIVAGASTLASVGVIGNATVGGTLDVTGASTFTSATVSDVLDVSGVDISHNLIVAGTLDVTGASTLDSVGVTNNASVGGTLGVTSNATVGGTLDVTGASTLDSVGVTNNASVGGTLGVTSNATVGGTLGVTGASTLDSVGVTNNASVGGTLGVTGASTFTSATVSDVLDASATTLNSLNVSTTANVMGTLTGTTVIGNDISGTTITGTTITGTTITGTTITGNDINGTTITGTTITGNDINGTTITGTSGEFIGVVSAATSTQETGLNLATLDWVIDHTSSGGGGWYYTPSSDPTLNPATITAQSNGVVYINSVLADSAITVLHLGGPISGTSATFTGQVAATGGFSGAITGGTTATFTGQVTAGSFNATSDIRLKENITNLDNSLDKICNIRGVNYNWKNDETKRNTVGVIAQEVLEQIPEAVNDNDSEKLSVDYNSIIAHLIESVKELKREIDELKTK